MKATALDQATQMVPLTLIDRSAFNPRRFFSEKELSELSGSISQTGVLQPILLRPQGDRFEIVYGERRYRASALAGLTEIPAMVRELTDAEAREIAITENLQRSDVEPLDEALAFKNLMEITGCTIADLVTRFGKSERYIRGRLRLNDLLPQLGELLSQRLISLASAIELSRYATEVQEEVYENHFKEEDQYQSWRDLTVKKLVSNIERIYTNDLNKFNFDKEACLNCPFNSSCNSLFPEADKLGNCSNQTCLDQKNADFIIARTSELVAEIPNIRLFYSHIESEVLITKIKEHGFEVKQTYNPCAYPAEPVKPEFAKGTKKEDKTALLEKYNDQVENHKTRMDALAVKLEEGILVQYGRIESTGIVLCYLEVDKPSISTPDSEIARLEAKDMRNKEIAKEKIVEDTKALLRNADFSGDFSEIEEKAIYFLMLGALRKGNFEAIGIKDKYYLENDDKMAIVENLTDEQKIIIRRDFLVQHLPSVYGMAQKLLIDVTKQHVPDGFAEVEKNHLDVYTKRHNRLKERIQALRAPKTGNIKMEKAK